MKQNTGEAYAFFYCSAEKDEIEELLPAIRKVARTPSDLELSLTGGADQVELDEELMALAKEAEDSGKNYMLRARWPDRTNVQTANELTAWLNQAYQSLLSHALDIGKMEIINYRD